MAYITINGFTVEESLAQMLVSDDAPEFVYEIDEVEETFLTPEKAMEYAEDIVEGWVGDLNVCEYRNNLRFDEEKREYTLADWDEAPLSFTGRYWTRKNEEWVEV